MSHAEVGGAGFRLVEHTSINPNKAAHVGHLRNAVLGDTFARMLKPDEYKPGFKTGVQNYIDNTGVQVADIVVAVTVLEGKTLNDVRRVVDGAAGVQPAARLRVLGPVCGGFAVVYGRSGPGRRAQADYGWTHCTRSRPVATIRRRLQS